MENQPHWKEAFCFLVFSFFATVYRKPAVSRNFYYKNHCHLLSAWEMPSAVFRASYMCNRYTTQPPQQPYEIGSYSQFTDEKTEDSRVRSLSQDHTLSMC